MSACGVDFGTSNSAVALPDGRVLSIDHDAAEPRLYRSVLFFPEDSKDSLSGASAISEYLRGAEGRFIQSVKGWLPSQTFHSTQIRNRSFRLEDLIAILLRRIREAAERVSNLTFDRAVVGRPAVFSTEPERDALAQKRLEDAARTAGFRDVRFVIEPIAAALAYEATLDAEELVLVADFGAGTSDLTIMRLSPSRREKSDRQDDVVASDGVHVGGDRFDAAIMRGKLVRYFGAESHYEIMGKRLPMPSHIVNKLLSWHEMSFIRERETQQLIDRMLDASDDIPAIEALQDLVLENLGFHLFRAIEKAKIDLSSEERTTLHFDHARIQIKERISRLEFERFSTPLLGELRACTDRVFQKAGIEEKQIDAVFLTGGSSHLPSVRALFADRFGKSRIRTADAFTSVAEGLGRSAGAI